MSSRYQNIPSVKVDNVREIHYANVIYPDVPLQNTDLYLITTLGDRLDIMAQRYYSDPLLWWVISSANNLPGDSIFPPIGVQLRIPIDIQAIMNSYKQINLVR